MAKTFHSPSFAESGPNSVSCNAPPSADSASPSPGGETAPYDVATDHHGLFRRVQVKCTICKRRNSYVCTISSCCSVYRPDQLDFFAAYVIPTDTWYIVPILATNSQRASSSPRISRNPNTANTRKPGTC
ncbi:MAG TPA: group I intron-associated PD-(D/E)XK endonuclease [Candidatus Eremiobacteraceae bacterium]|nr:group I intron-associated PD-(D/E)XK endonuclease [Candidatus Eremiobacteraceae bacterium]